MQQERKGRKNDGEWDFLRLSRKQSTKVLLGSSYRTSTYKKMKKLGLGRKNILNHDVPARKTSVDDTGSSEAGMALQHYPELR